MRNITENELHEILRKHNLWLNGECGERANLSRADLSRANLSRADLSRADLCGADLRWANLSGAYLGGANLGGANLRCANLGGADLGGADLGHANLSGADLNGAKHIPYIPLACPEEGSFIGFKKAYADLLGLDPVIVRLLVLEDAKRSSATSNKCRCSKAKVLDIQKFDGHGAGVVAYSGYDRTFKYKIGEVVEVKDFDENRFNECAPGIHFFINRQDAVYY